MKTTSANTKSVKYLRIEKTTAKIAQLIFVACLFVFASNLPAQTLKDFTRYVNPFIGTGGHGHTFPGATVPHGAVQLSPDTRIDNWDGSSGYHYSDNEIFGFSHTHLSGTGIPDYCDILLTPTIDGNTSRKFSHANETATAGFYSVKMDNGILAELTATTRVGFHRYTFPDGKFVNLFLDLKWRDKVLDSELKLVGKNRVEGFRRSSSWAKDQIIYFVAEFSEPFASHAIAYDNTITEQGERATQGKGTNLGVSLRFKNPLNKKIMVKVALSAVSIEGARKNLDAELPDWNFEKVRTDAKTAWNKELSKIEVSGGTDAEMTNFYTALYHANIQPNLFQDVDGKYLGLDKKVHEAPKDTNYTIFSLWDTFRAAHPLYTIIDQKRTVDYINTFIRQYEQGGRLPVWELAGNETDCMIGYHSVSVIADAMTKGIKGFDYEKAFDAAKHSADLNHFGLEAYKRRGYISSEDENESVSKTLEYAYDDFCIAQMAQVLLDQKTAKSGGAKTTEGGADEDEETKNLKDDFRKFSLRSQTYKNVFDPETGFMRPKKNGNFVKPFAPNEVTFHFTEGNSWQYSFFVPHNVADLMKMQGDAFKFEKKLDELFTTDAKLAGREQPDLTGLIGQYAHGNEPSHHIAYLYNRTNAPWKTQKIIRRIMDEFYKPTPDGLIGNEDCGQMSAWYILSALGFYQVNPSQPFYDTGTPLFKEAKINFENGKSLIIKAPNVSPTNFYVRSITLNGKKYPQNFLSHKDLMNGGTLEFDMTAASNQNLYPLSFRAFQEPEELTAVPVIEATDRIFRESTTVSMKSNSPDAAIFYTTDGSEPNYQSTKYEKPFTIDKTTVIKAIAIGHVMSQIVESKLNRLPHDWAVKISSKYNRQYTGGGDIGLIDGIRGTLNFASGEWQGYQPQDFVAVVDLQRETEIKTVGGGFLQNARSWIWMPTHITFEVSDDNVNFRPVADIKTDVAPDDMKEQMKDYTQNISPVKARYVRVHAYNLGKIPAWHPGAGDDAFIFVDEIFIQ